MFDLRLFRSDLRGYNSNMLLIVVVSKGTP
nr:MAG TPA: hypothetical protein [Caudoviricetes sp.]